MSIKLGKLCSTILEQHFGKNVRMVGECLFSAIHSRDLFTIIKSTGLTKSNVINALGILIKFQIVKFTAREGGSGRMEYVLHPDKILFFLRYPRYNFLIQSKFDVPEATITDELLRSGTETASCLIANSANSVEINTLERFIKGFVELVQNNYFIRAPVITDNNVPKTIEANLFFTPPEIDIHQLVSLKNGENIETIDKDIFWMINYDRFHQDFRDALMITAIERRIDLNAGECFKYILQQMYAVTDAWQTRSNPVALNDLKQYIEKKSKNTELIKYLEQYVSVIADDQLQFLTRCDSSASGKYVVELKTAIEQLTWACIENIITEKFGSKAARVFRVVRLKKYTQQEDIHKGAMIPLKLSKLLTYQLLNEQIFQIKPIRKAGGGGTGQAKSFFLFYVNQKQIVSVLLEICYTAVYSSITRTNMYKTENCRLIEKAERVECIVETMKERNEPEEYITEMLESITPPEKQILENTKFRIKKLYSAEIAIDETMFLLQLYDFYKYLK